MFHLFPKTRQEWIAIFIFPFQVYAALGLITTLWCFERGRYADDKIGVGSLICAFVLFSVGLRQIVKGERPKAYMNFALAALAVISVLLPVPIRA
jgi:hypothetical protein